VLPPFVGSTDDFLVGFPVSADPRICAHLILRTAQTPRVTMASSCCLADFQLDDISYVHTPRDHVDESSSKNMTATFTEKQGQYLAFIHTYMKLNRRPPAEADMQDYFGVTPPTVHQMVLQLEKRGLIRRRPRQARSIELLVAAEAIPPLR
jgi:hypothetical protein